MRHLATACLLLGCVFANARQISPGEALSLASDFMNSSQLQSASQSSMTLTPFKAPGVKVDSQSSPYYVFNRGEADGFVIISGDDRAPKILGYSDKGSFDAENMPPQLKAMMEQWAKQMENLPATATQHPSWTTAPSTRAGEILLETANWGQGYPYNEKVPIMDGERCQAGCVATAMSIIMKYNNWPESFDWDAMPMNTESDPIDYSASYPAIANLMAQAGEAVYMNYSPFESGADMNWVGHKMQNKFKYSPDCQFISSTYFSEEQWNEMIKDNLDAGHPIIYTGSGSGSHAFVLDGYNAQGYHINWGWDGMYNGYFVLDNLAPNEFQDFSEYTGMVLNIVPDRSGDIYSECFVDNGYFYGLREGLLDPMNISVENVVKGEPFHVANKVATFPNEFYGLYGLALVSENNEIKEVLKTHDIQENNDDVLPFRGYTMNFKNIVVTTDIAPNDRLQLVTKKAGEDDFRLMLGTLEHPSYINVVGNTPKVVDLKINVGTGVKFQYKLFEDDWVPLEAGTYDFHNILKGLDLSYYCGPEIEQKDKTVILTLKGDYIYGDLQNFRIDKDFYSSFLGLNSDYEIDAKVYEFVEENIVLEKAGTLKEELAGIEKNSIRHLTVSGKINAVDIWYLRDYCPSLEYLDIRNAAIEAVYAEDEKMTQFDRHPDNEANTMPEFGLSSLRCLNTLLLPESLTGLCDYSLCDLNLQSLTFPVGVTSIGLNLLSGNSRLKAIELLNPDPVFIRDCVFDATLCPYEGMLYIPNGSSSKFKDAVIWQDFKEIIEGSMPNWTNSVKVFPGSVHCYNGDKFQLEALVYPVENVKDIIWSSSNESVAIVDAEGNVSVVGSGLAIITAKAADELGVYDECRIEADFRIGDANVDGVVNIADAVTIANVIVGLPVAYYDYASSDMNADGIITVSDVTSIISLIPSQVYHKASSSSDRSNIPASISGYMVTSKAIDGAVDLFLSSDESIAALQFDVCLPVGSVVPEIELPKELAATHSLQQFMMADNKVRIVLYSVSGRLLPNDADSSVLTIKGVASEDVLKFENIFGSDAFGRSMILGVEDFDVSNGVIGSTFADTKVIALNGHVVISNAVGASVAVYALDGSCLGVSVADSEEYIMPLESGMYIVKVGTHSYRVIIK